MGAHSAPEIGTLGTNAAALIAHDLKTPVTAVLGALSGLRDDFHRFDARTRTELLDIAQGEAERLERFVRASSI
jgi:K+-sensing histidine kinase KdpD